MRLPSYTSTSPCPFHNNHIHTDPSLVPHNQHLPLHCSCPFVLPPWPLVLLHHFPTALCSCNSLPLPPTPKFAPLHPPPLTTPPPLLLHLTFSVPPHPPPTASSSLPQQYLPLPFLNPALNFASSQLQYLTPSPSLTPLPPLLPSPCPPPPQLTCGTPPCTISPLSKPLPNPPPPPLLSPACPSVFPHLIEPFHYSLPAPSPHFPPTSPINRPLPSLSPAAPPPAFPPPQVPPVSLPANKPQGSQHSNNVTSPHQERH